MPIPLMEDIPRSMCRMLFRFIYRY